MFEHYQYKKFRIEGETIYWKNSSFPITIIKHIFFRRLLTTQRENLMKVGEAHSAYLTITFDNGKKITLIVDESTILFGLNRDKSNDLRKLENIYLYLARTTFKKRITFYNNQVKKNGFFVYDGCRFEPRAKKIIFRNKEFPIAETSFFREAGCIEFMKKDFGAWDKIKRQIGLTKIPQFNTQTDTDVIFYLLDHYFGLRWTNSNNWLDLFNKLHDKQLSQ